MDDVFLYNHIKQAIKQRKQFSTDTHEVNFAEKYCRRQLMKKKLTHHNNNSKMKSLMKNFAHLDTYVDLNELLFSINQIRNKQLANQKIQNKTAGNTRGFNLNKLNKTLYPRVSDNPFAHQNQSLDHIQILKNRVMVQIGELIRRKYQNSQVNQINQLIDIMEQNSSMQNSLLNNNSNNYISYLDSQLQKIQKQEQLNGTCNSDNWRIFKQLQKNLNNHNYNINKITNKRFSRKQYFRSTILNSKQKKEQNQLLHKISTFLHIALENEHKEKWATKDMKKFRSTHGSFRFKSSQPSKSNFSPKINSLQKQNNLSSISSNLIEKKHSILLSKIKSEQRSIFGQNPRESCNLIKRQSMRPSSLLFRNTAPHNLKNNECEILADDGTITSQFASPLIIQKQSQLRKTRQKITYDFIQPRKAAAKTMMITAIENLEHETPLSSPVQSINKLYSTSTPSENDLLNRSEAVKSTSASIFRNQSRSLTRKQRSPTKKLTQNFTFKRRNIKQMILNKLQDFIHEVNHEEKMSKMQNVYYDNAINQLQDISKTAYKNYIPQALAGQQQIDQLKRFVNTINPALRKTGGKGHKMVVR